MFRQLKGNVWLVIGAILLALVLPQSVYAWPDNLKRSFQLEIFRNSGLSSTDFRYMAAAVLIAEQGLSRDQALEKTKAMNISEAKQLLTRDFPIEYYEIPVSLLQADGEFRAQKLNDQSNLQLFKKGDQTYARWFKHPLHSAPEFENKYKAYQGEPGRYRAMLTSSRSLLIKDTQTEEYWSLKGSLKMAQGPFKNKAYNSIQAQYHLQMSNIISSDKFLRNRFFLDVSNVSLKNETFDEGQTLRSLKPYEEGGRIQALATLFDPRVSIPLARLNGFGDDWKEFLAKKVMPFLGETMGHLYANYGLTHNSLHSQNVTVHFDAKGKFKSVLVRDPDFDVDISKYAEVFGQEKADTYIAKSNIYQPNTLSIDFSVLNGLLNNGWDREEKVKIYRELGAAFFQTFAEKTAEVRHSKISKEEIYKRINSVMNIDEEGRTAANLSARRLENIINPDSFFDTKYAHQKPTESLRNAKSLILTQIKEGSLDLSKYIPEELDMAWKELAQEFARNPQNSELASILKANKSEEIVRMINMLNAHKSFEHQTFMKTLIEFYPEIIRKQNTAFFFYKHRDEEIMKNYLTRASQNALEDLWEGKRINFLLDYSQEVLNRYFALVSPELKEKIIKEIATNEYRHPILLNPDLIRLKSKIEIALQTRETLKAKSSTARTCNAAHLSF